MADLNGPNSSLEDQGQLNLWGGSIHPQGKRKKSLKPKRISRLPFSASWLEIDGVATLVCFLPILTVSEANNFDPWREKHKRHSAQKKAAFWALNSNIKKITLPCTVKMVRLGLRLLDEEDNLRMSLKYLKDGIAELLTGDYVAGRADSDKRIKWEYDQEIKSDYAVRLEIKLN